MTDFESRPDGLLVPALFPISSEAKDEVVEFLETDPNLLDVAAELTMLDPVLSQVSAFMMQSWGIEPAVQHEFADGAVVTFKVIRAQALFSGVTLPITEADFAKDYFAGLDATKPKIGKYLPELVDKIEDLDDRFCDTVHAYTEGHTDEEDELTDYEKTAAVFGSFTLYDFMRAQYEAIDLRNGSFEL